MRKILLAFALALAACNHASSAGPGPTQTARLDIAVTEKGFEPDNVNVPAGKPVTLVFDRKTDQTCATEVVIPMPDGRKIEKKLPLNVPVEVATTFSSPGKLTYACGLNMMKATITVQ